MHRDMVGQLFLKFPQGEEDARRDLSRRNLSREVDLVLEDRAPAPVDRRAADQVGLIGGRMIEQEIEEHTSELQSLMRISYAVFCLKKKKYQKCNYQTCKQTSNKTL